MPDIPAAGGRLNWSGIPIFLTTLICALFYSQIAAANDLPPARSVRSVSRPLATLTPTHNVSSRPVKSKTGAITQVQASGKPSAVRKPTRAKQKKTITIPARRKKATIITKQAVYIDPSNVILPEVPTKQLVLRYTSTGAPLVEGLGALTLAHDDQGTFAIDEERRRVYLTLDSNLQSKAQQILERNRVSWGAIVAIEPKSGRVKALAGLKRNPDSDNKSVAMRATFPAASLFKMITAAAALERGGLSTREPIRFRGSDYLLSRWNYLPNSKLDRRVMDLSTALGKSCNPVFARVALQNLDTPILERYAVNFGFNSEIPFDINVETSRFNLEGDSYDLARTAAGFGEVSISPLHAALITAAIANSGKMMKPYVVDRIVAADGKLEYQAQSASLRYPILSSTAQQLLEMMKQTVESGTAKKHFTKLRQSTFRDIEVAAKTGTLSGDNPKGMYYWFVAAAPADNPEIAIAVLVIDTGGGRVRGTALGKELLEHYFTHRPDSASTLPVASAPVPQQQVRSTRTE